MEAVYTSDTLHIAVCINPGVDNVPKMEHAFQIILSDSWLCWVNAAYIQPTLHIHFWHTAGALQFDLGYHNIRRLYAQAILL